MYRFYKAQREKGSKLDSKEWFKEKAGLSEQQKEVLNVNHIIELLNKFKEGLERLSDKEAFTSQTELKNLLKRSNDFGILENSKNVLRYALNFQSDADIKRALASYEELIQTDIKSLEKVITRVQDGKFRTLAEIFQIIKENQEFTGLPSMNDGSNKEEETLRQSGKLEEFLNGGGNVIHTDPIGEANFSNIKLLQLGEITESMKE